MSNIERITIEEWAGDNNLSLTESQIEDLCDGLDAAHDMSIYSTGWTLGHSANIAQEEKIKELQGIIRQYEGFLSEKGYSGISCTYNGIKHWHMVNCGDRSYSQEDTYKY